MNNLKQTSSDIGAGGWAFLICRVLFIGFTVVWSLFIAAIIPLALCVFATKIMGW